MAGQAEMAVKYLKHTPAIIYPSICVKESLLSCGSAKPKLKWKWKWKLTCGRAVCGARWPSRRQPWK